VGLLPLRVEGWLQRFVGHGPTVFCDDFERCRAGILQGDEHGFDLGGLEVGVVFNAYKIDNTNSI
jgi:hypothetical protein